MRKHFGLGFGSVLSAVTLAAVLPSAASAQSVNEDEILVTAQRRAERVQDIPLAVSAFSAAAIQEQGIVTLEQVAPRVPNFYFGSFGALRPQLYIRGIGSHQFDPGSEASVGVFADDAYLGRSSGVFGSMKDIERIEVLRGPQGTLYGRNTIGGAINVITRAPTETFEAQAEIGASNYDGYDLFGVVSGPLAESGAVRGRVAAWRTYRDGYMTNLTTGNRFQGTDNWGGRARLDFVPNDRLTIGLTAEISRDDGQGFAGESEGAGPWSAGPPPAAVNPANPLFVFFAAGGGPEPQPTPDRFEAYLSFDPRLQRDIDAYAARVDYDAASATLTSITSFRSLDASDSRDLEGSSLSVIDQYSTETSDQWTQEFRITSNPGGALSFGGRLDWILGVFYYHDESSRRDRFELGVNSVIGGGGAQTDTTSTAYETESSAIFGQATYHFTDAFEVTLGARYTHDSKEATSIGTTTDAAPLVPAPFATTNEDSWSSFDPRIVATYHFSPDLTIYASWSTGFKSGGFQYVPFSAAQADIIFNPEEIEAFEVGLKSEWFDRRLRVNLAAFHYDYQDLQITRIINTPAPVNLITNAAASTIQGVDVEFNWLPTENLELNRPGFFGGS